MWVTRVFANNLYLESAATTGTLGLLAICGTLAASAQLTAAQASLGARRAPRPSLASVGGLVAAIAGPRDGVDYLLAFTAHCLVLATRGGHGRRLARGATP